MKQIKNQEYLLYMKSKLKIYDLIKKLMSKFEYPSERFGRKLMSNGITKDSFIKFLINEDLLDEVLSYNITIPIDGLPNSFIDLVITDFDAIEIKNEYSLVCYDFMINDCLLVIGEREYTDLIEFFNSKNTDFIKEFVKTQIINSFTERMESYYYLPFVFSQESKIYN